jgi:hypothetical protein
MSPNSVAEGQEGDPGSTAGGFSALAETAAAAKTSAVETAAENSKPGAAPACAGMAAAVSEEAGAVMTSAAGVAMAGESSPEPDATPDSVLTEAVAGLAASVGEVSATAAEDERELMKADSSILDCSIMSFTLGENFTPKENSLASLLMSGPLALEFLEPS